MAPKPERVSVPDATSRAHVTVSPQRPEVVSSAAQRMQESKRKRRSVMDGVGFIISKKH